MVDNHSQSRKPSLCKLLNWRTCFCTFIKTDNVEQVQRALAWQTVLSANETSQQIEIVFAGCAAEYAAFDMMTA